MTITPFESATEICLLFENECSGLFDNETVTEAALALISKAPGKKVVFDLSGLSHSASSTLAVLIMASRALSPIRVTLKNVSSQMAFAIKVFEVESLFEFAE